MKDNNLIVDLLPQTKQTLRESVARNREITTGGYKMHVNIQYYSWPKRSLQHWPSDTWWTQERGSPYYC